LDAGQSCVKTVYVKATQPGERKFAVLVNYAIETRKEKPTSPAAPLHAASNVVPLLINRDSSAESSSSASSSSSSSSTRCLCLASADLSMQATRPFQIVTKPLTMKFEATETVFDKEPFLLTCDVKCVSEWPIEIKTSHLTRSEMMLLPEGETSAMSHLDDLEIEPHDICRDIYCLVPSLGTKGPSLQQQQQPGTGANLPLGSFSIEWRRRYDDDSIDLPFVKSSMTLPYVPCQSLPLSVDLKLPAFGTLRSPMPVRYRLENRTMLPQDLEIVVESSEGFMFSGPKQLTMRLLPTDHQDLIYNLFPLVAGNVVLPRLNVTMTRYPNLALAETVHKLIPSHIFVIPAKKDGVSASSTPPPQPPPAVSISETSLTDVAN